ncbi:hypothetical protein Hanom_Chr15g01374171 [Helianthus anomalus]
MGDKGCYCGCYCSVDCFLDEVLSEDILFLMNDLWFDSFYNICTKLNSHLRTRPAVTKAPKNSFQPFFV